ncbi:protein FAR1-RELATED SEQUENCE 5-like [Chenopodium quinoa]|uniref:protein FAR1-RELATED SEQUENCE 5-like n=1 Tax=Chenopodium quinoa TaxID=63459 RepID=UPI000B77C2D7|nr:protein FAR1-RELATED SEQUENCE 5-like [Chenopodium quinoa]
MGYACFSKQDLGKLTKEEIKCLFIASRFEGDLEGNVNMGYLFIQRCLEIKRSTEFRGEIKCGGMITIIAKALGFTNWVEQLTPVNGSNVLDLAGLASMQMLVEIRGNDTTYSWLVKGKHRCFLPNAADSDNRNGSDVDTDTDTDEIPASFLDPEVWEKRGRFRAAKNLNRPDRKCREKAVTRCGCKASISFKWDHRSDSWYVKDFLAEQNGHDPIPMNQMSHREVTEGDKIRIKALINSGVKPSITMRNLTQSAGGIRELGFLKKDLYNTCEKFKREEIKDGDKETGDYKGFGKVIAFDATYKVNAYQNSFVVVVGVNHHRKTVPLGVALIANEKIDTCEWVLQQLLEVGGNVAPYIVVTDGDNAMASAIKTVFPHAHHRLSLWHIMHKIKGHTNKRFCNGFMKCVYGARTPIEFEEAWEDFMKAYDIVRDKKWAQNMYNDKDKWAEAFMVG